MTDRVYFRGSREEARAIARRLKAMLIGKAPDSLGIAKGVFTAIGFAALADIRDDFLTKARGGTGEDGEKWPPLSKEYLAYGRRFGKGEQAALKKRAGLGEQHKYAPGNNKGLLTAVQLKRWNKLFAQYLKRFMVSMPIESAKERAAQVAWSILKKEGAQTKLNIFGSRQVDVLRDTGVLFNSLSPGQISGGGPQSVYRPPSGPGGEDQVFDTIANGVIVGTTVPYAAAHNYGVPGKMPKRQFLPARTPDAWKERWVRASEQALLAGAKLAYEVRA